MAEEQVFEIHGEVRRTELLFKVKAKSKKEALEKAQHLEFPNDYVENSKFVVGPEDDEYTSHPRRHDPDHVYVGD